ncbi:hypothetical protein FH972_025568 [Carpinus fangiana]|uniref:HMA domain-containing protein n=1 Tax=Carpinus fangiana TaxID=176857 RepID=A0A5N6L1N2_9ROSI|nr:hypothetical protein FH972_025568 [Carpinus fangiana]
MLAHAQHLALLAPDLAAQLRHAPPDVHHLAVDRRLCADAPGPQVRAVDGAADAGELPEARARDGRNGDRGQDVEDRGCAAAVQVVHAVAERGVDGQGEGGGGGGGGGARGGEEVDVLVDGLVPVLLALVRTRVCFAGGAFVQGEGTLTPEPSSACSCWKKSLVRSKGSSISSLITIFALCRVVLVRSKQHEEAIVQRVTVDSAFGVSQVLLEFIPQLHLGKRENCKMPFLTFDVAEPRNPRTVKNDQHKGWRRVGQSASYVCILTRPTQLERTRLRSQTHGLTRHSGCYRRLQAERDRMSKFPRKGPFPWHPHSTYPPFTVYCITCPTRYPAPVYPANPPQLYLSATLQTKTLSYKSRQTATMADTAADHKYLFNVTMSCGGCSGAVERVLKKLDGVKSFDVSLETQTAQVVAEPSLEYSTVLEKIKKTGKAVTGAQADGQTMAV